MGRNPSVGFAEPGRCLMRPRPLWCPRSSVRSVPTNILRHILSTNRRNPFPLDVSACGMRSEEHTSELQSLMRISYAVFCLKKNKYPHHDTLREHHITITDV